MHIYQIMNIYQKMSLSNSNKAILTVIIFVLIPIIIGVTLISIAYSMKTNWKSIKSNNCLVNSTEIINNDSMSGFPYSLHITYVSFIENKNDLD